MSPDVLLFGSTIACKSADALMMRFTRSGVLSEMVTRSHILAQIDSNAFSVRCPPISVWSVCAWMLDFRLV
ncbi:hypothetical protein BD410DRAFT_847117 [Rickenella mellea]|uniref:Uncharacterized protein n=1 Tax=Rickenella mellea TaxID=50990 RepID=A0A4Y7PFL9_9AGAM|nr:hypothetical protein BD410DRAFT_847117 [Rickenella mellea]